jgi:GDP-4-dehydro-6-deoxy-D-mannose reductase
MRIFVTGATGFAGSFLVEALLSAGHVVWALVHQQTSHQALVVTDAVHPIVGNLLDGAQLKTAVAQAQPDVIYHLAGQAYPARSWQDPAHTVAVNTIGTINLLEAAAAYGRPRVVVITSAEIYGVVREDDLPLTEATVPQPRHPYGVSKLAASQFIPIYWQRYQLPVMEARPFNHIGPHQSAGFVVPDFASQLAAIKLGRQSPKLSVGNLDAQRDFTDVRDVVRAYLLLAEKGQPGEAYFVCSGQPVSIHYLLSTLIELAEVTVDIEYDPARMRPSDVPCLYGSYRKIQNQTGWQPQIDLRQSLADALEDWLARLRPLSLPLRLE